MLAGNNGIRLNNEIVTMYLKYIEDEYVEIEVSDDGGQIREDEEAEYLHRKGLLWELLTPNAVLLSVILRNEIMANMNRGAGWCCEPVVLEPVEMESVCLEPVCWSLCAEPMVLELVVPDQWKLKLLGWFEKLESVFRISDCREKDKVKFATATLQGRALTWWNGRTASMGIDAANGTPMG
ncbi:hypothetical protein Tco_0924978 [Tanacetum coccineum]|uniref:Reverse transcriptase domain-containing protein n=1 Tax=Tanacetum coccineum TaxID=301880 RepID=A0ABQ5DBR0_9ASTR